MATKHSRLRLRRLQAIVAQRATGEWGRSYIEGVLAQDPDSPDARCPRYAGVSEESGDHCLIVADTVVQLALEMAGLADNEIPITPVELIDLDTGRSRQAYRETTVYFLRS